MGKAFHNWRHLERTQSPAALVCWHSEETKAFHVLCAAEPGSVLPGVSPRVTLLPISNGGARDILRGPGGMSPLLPSGHPHPPSRRVTASSRLFSPVDRSLF